MNEIYQHMQTGMLLCLEWESSNEVGLAGGGFAWTGTREALAREFRLLRRENAEPKE
jgi:hypothetical protein